MPGIGGRGGGDSVMTGPAGSFCHRAWAGTCAVARALATGSAVVASQTHMATGGEWPFEEPRRRVVLLSLVCCRPDTHLNKEM